jgi:dipeptidyl aminopeptidase/acylaminoacyl peptidase
MLSSRSLLQTPKRPSAPRAGVRSVLVAAAALASSSAFALASACAPPNASTPYPEAEPPMGEVTPPGIVRYFERTVDLGPILEGFPYERFEASIARQRLFFLETGEGYTLKSMELPASGGPLDLRAAQAISDVDWSTRSLWELHLPAEGSTLWLHADARNDERMNLWTLDVQSGALAQVTDHDYVYGFGFSEDDARVAYLPRAGATAAQFRTCLRVREVASGSEREVICDSPALSFTWSSPRFSADGREVYFTALVDGDRNRKQLVAVDLTAERPSVRRITDDTPRSRLSLVRGWLPGERLVFIANDDGFANLYTYERGRGELRQLSRLREDVSDAALLDVGVLAVSGTPAGSTVSLFDGRAAAGPAKILGQDRQPGKIRLIDGHGLQAAWSREAPDLLFEAKLATFSMAPDGGAPGLRVAPLIALEPERAAGLVHCQAAAVKIPTHDVDPATKATRQLHAFVLRPREPIAAPTQRRALIKAFYGGDNRYSAFDQVMCAAGLTVISPAVRGSRGFGKDFAALNDRDLGGAEIRDLFAVGRWVESELGLQSWQVGVYGGSHGGYATMRALTYEPAPDRYPFGFGLAHAGFSDILTFFAATNIPDWVVLESGDPKVAADAAKMRERSPLTHVERLEAPLLLTHGEADARVPVAESRQIADKGKAQGRPVTYVEFPGQGHHIEGLARLVEFYQANFDLLEAAGAGHGGEASAPSPAPAG